MKLTGVVAPTILPYRRQWLGKDVVAGLVLTAAERSQLDTVSRPPLLYPYWHQANTASDRLSPADLSLLGPHFEQ